VVGTRETVIDASLRVGRKAVDVLVEDWQGLTRKTSSQT
jgi:hypothetical protein